MLEYCCRGDEILKEVIAHRDDDGKWHSSKPTSKSVAFSDKTTQNQSQSSVEAIGTDLMPQSSDRTSSSDDTNLITVSPSTSSAAVCVNNNSESSNASDEDYCPEDSSRENCATINSTNSVSTSRTSSDSTLRTSSCASVAAVALCTSSYHESNADVDEDVKLKQSDTAAACTTNVITPSLATNADAKSATVKGHAQLNDLNLNDPIRFTGRRLTANDVQLLVSLGPCQPTVDYKFPVTNRAFNPEWFTCEMPDKTNYQRKWLTYSTSTDKAYCLPCIGFSGPLGSATWTNTGYDGWHNGKRDLVRHESSPEHRAAEITLIQWIKGKTVAQMTNKNHSCVVDDNRKVMECVIDCVKFLTAEMLACWGKDASEGKFIALFSLLAKRDASAAAYLKRIDQERLHGKKMAVNFLSPSNVRNVLKAMKQLVVGKIVKCIESQRKACIIFDSTQDYSKREASVMLVRYMEADDTGELAVVERLLEVFTTGETSGAILTERVFEVLRRLKFDLDWLVGQCYDGAGNMRGKYKGLATLIREKCNKAVYIWCHAHRLNLVVNSVSTCSTDVRNTLGLLEELYTFMSGHKRNDVFIREQCDEGGRRMQLKRVSTTRWNSSQAAVETVLLKYNAVQQALSHLSQPQYDSETITLAAGLRSRLTDIRVIVAMHVLKLVYSIIGPASRSLQGIATDLAIAATLLADCNKKFKEMREEADNEWAKIYDEAVRFANAHEISCEIPTERRRKKKKMDDELAEDESLTGKQLMKVSMFIAVLDEILQQLQNRFSDHNVTFMKQLSYFTPAGLHNNTYKDTIADDIRPICEQYGLSSIDVHKELVDFRTTYRLCCPNLTIPSKLHFLKFLNVKLDESFCFPLLLIGAC